MIVKPCNLGSSAGVSTAASADELIAGVLKVFEYDVEALIEPFIKNRLELNVAVAGLDEPVASVTEMPVTSQASPLTFSEKYKRQGRKSIGSSEGMAGALRVLDPAGPAGGDARQRATLRRRPSLRRSAARAFRESTSSSTPTRTSCIFNEINTLPGSLAFYLWSAAPHYWTITELLTRLIDRAERLRAMKRGLQRKPPRGTARCFVAVRRRGRRRSHEAHEGFRVAAAIGPHGFRLMACDSASQSVASLLLPDDVELRGVGDRHDRHHAGLHRDPTRPDRRRRARCRPCSAR